MINVFIKIFYLPSDMSFKIEEKTFSESFYILKMTFIKCVSKGI